MLRAVIIALALALLLAVLYYTPAVAPTAPTAPPATGSVSQPSTLNSQLPPNSQPSSPPPDPSEFPLNAPTTDIHADLRLVSDLLGTFRSNFPQGGNPTGTNAEITAVLTGRNKLRFAFLAPKHPAINSAGELCDRWGTPFFFHAESATRMEIRSAGPDKKMWTPDDVLFSP